MTPEEWQRIRPILESALELEPASRARFLDESCAEASVRHEVESLIRLHEESGTGFLNAPVNPAFLFEEEARFRLVQGKRIGPYEILGEIAQGGMGAVYRAVRADGQYRQQVALKIVRADLGVEVTAARFRNERQILANLDHPNIAKILDGGSTADGLPYFVMEFIDGLPITDYCDQHKLSIDARLQLFRTVCSAVHYAHQRLVIHRDIKPTNILITADGVPKLLDFGIAKLLDPTSIPENFTLTAGAWMLTPEYASPEQLRGDAITTATDVYSLGLVLYELLTGRRAYRFPSRMPHEIARAVLETEPEKPSTAIRCADDPEERQHEEIPRTPELIGRPRGDSPEKLQRRLVGDLDNIVLKAIRKEPRERYNSAEQLSDDIRRHLDALPVLARKSTVAYRFRKYVLRHKVGVGAAALVFLSLLSGIALTLREARIARQQAEIASQQQLRAERRFNDVRKLANSLMFEVHDSIKDLPGATPARRVLVDRALEYLDSLAQEAKGDLALQRELAAAYDRVGDLLGYNGAANLGDLPGALRSYKKALTIRELSASSFPDDVQAQSDLCGDYFRLGFVLQDAGDYAGALSNLHNAIPVAQKLADTHTDPKYRDILAGMYWKTAEVLVASGDGARALENYQTAFAIREPAANAANANLWTRIHHAGDYISLGTILGRTGDIGRSREYSERGTQLLEQLSKSDPANATLQEYLGEAYDLFASVLTQQGELADALSYSRKSNKVFTRLLSADPANALAKDNLALTRTRTADLLIQLGKVDEALPTIKGAIASFEGIEHKNRYQVAGQANAYSALATAFVSLAGREASPPEKAAHLRSARSWYQKSLQTWQVYRGLSYGGNLAGDQSEGVARQLAKCEAALARLQNRRPPSGQSSASQH